MASDQSIEDLIAERMRLAVEVNSIMQRIEDISATIEAHFDPVAQQQQAQEKAPSDGSSARSEA